MINNACLSDFELHSRWVPLNRERHNCLHDTRNRLVLEIHNVVTKLKSTVRIDNGSRVNQNTYSASYQTFRV